MPLNNGHRNGKCEFLCIINRKNPVIHTYYIATSPIKEVTSTKYLGVLTDKLTWDDHIQSVTHKAAQVYGFLYRSLGQCPSHIKDMCFKSMVCLILEYVPLPYETPYSCQYPKT